MVQQLSDAELEIMKIVWGNPEEVTAGELGLFER